LLAIDRHNGIMLSKHVHTRQLVYPGMREEVQVLDISRKNAATYSFHPSQHDANINLDATCYVPKSTASEMLGSHRGGNEYSGAV